MIQIGKQYSSKLFRRSAKRVCARIGLRLNSETLVGFDSDLLGKKGIIHLSPNGCQALSSFILIYSYYSFCLEYWNNSETLIGIELV